MACAPAGQRVVIIGAGGHARVLQSSLVAMNITVLGAVERPGTAMRPGGPLEIIGSEALLAGELASEHLVIGVGAVPSKGATGLHIRRRIFEAYMPDDDGRLICVIDPSAVLRGSVDLGRAVQILAGAVIQTETRIGANVVANTGCRIDHDCSIGDHSFIGPGAVLCGGVTLGEGCFIGANATVLPGISIGANAVVAAGSTVARNVPPDGYNPR